MKKEEYLRCVTDQIRCKKACPGIEKELVQKFLNKWTIFLFCSILFSSNQKEH